MDDWEGKCAQKCKEKCMGRVIFVTLQFVLNFVDPAACLIYWLNLLRFKALCVSRL